MHTFLLTIVIIGTYGTINNDMTVIYVLHFISIYEYNMYDN